MNLKLFRAAFPNSQYAVNSTLYLGLLALAAPLAFLAFISGQFDYLIPISDRPTYLAVALMIGAGLIYIWYITWLLKQSLHVSVFPVLAIGLMIRLFFYQSTPIHEDDHYRYFFDASLVSQGLSPYQYAPNDFLDNTKLLHHSVLPFDLKHQPLEFLNTHSHIERVAYPHIKTIYPSVTQSIFLLSHSLAPNNLDMWRSILLIADSLTLFLLCKLLARFKKPKRWAAVYWLNPLLITETYNAAHMDVLILPALLLTLLFAHKKQWLFACLSLSVAVGIKIWPIILFPFLLQPLVRSPKQLISHLILSGGMCLILLWPQINDLFDHQSGLVNFTENWRTNAFVFGLVEDALIWLEQGQDIYLGIPSEVARYLVAIAFVLICLLSMRKGSLKAEHLSYAWLIAIGALFMLSPTGYPWYIIWFLPLLALHIHSNQARTLLWLTCLLPLYDLRYTFQGSDNELEMSNFTIAIQFFPIILALIWFNLSQYSSSNNRN